MSKIVVGLLNACTPSEETEFQTKEIDSFQAFIDAASHNLKFVEYRITEGEFPSSPDACDAYWITGSPKGVYDVDPWIGQLTNFVQAAHNADKKLVGICFGHQMLAHALGGHAEKSDKGWGIGLQEVALTLDEEPAWMTPSLSTAGKKQLYFCHQDQVLTLPPNATRLGGSEFCPNAMFTIGNQVLGIQGHPEFTDSIMSLTIEYLAGNLDASLITDATKTVGMQTHSKEVAQWIVNFLNS